MTNRAALLSPDLASISAHLRPLWKKGAFRREIAKIANVFENILTTDSNHGLVLVKGNDEEFGPIRTMDSAHMTARPTFTIGSELGIKASMEICMRFLLTLAFFEEDEVRPVRLRTILRDLLQGTGTHFAIVGKHVLNAVEGGFLQLTASELDGVLDRMGSELLPSYEYGRAEEVQLLVLQFLHATVQIWGKEEAMELGFVDNARKLSAWFTAQHQTDNMSSARVRVEFIALLDAFLSPDLSHTAWGHESEVSACHQGTPIPPITVAISMLEIDDFRTRFMLAPVLGHLCSYLHDVGRQEFNIWESIANARDFDLSVTGFESNITLLLAYGNVMVASDYFRSNAYKPIVVYASLNTYKTTSLFVKSLLDGIAVRLGLRDLAQLYTFLAPYTMAEQIMDNQEGLAIPDPEAFGFSSKRDLHKAAFVDVAAMVLAGPRPDYFEQMCTFVGRTYQLALQECLPVFIAYRLSLARTIGFDTELHKREVAQIESKIEDVAKMSGKDVQDIMRSMQDLVIFKIFSFIWEAEYDIETFRRAFESGWPGVFDKLEDMVDGVQEPFQPNVLSPPDIRLEEVLAVLRCGHPAVADGLTNEAVLYSVLHRLLVSVTISPFVSQQRRLLYNTAICIACSFTTVCSNLSILSLILRLLAQILKQVDLVILASGIFRWISEQCVASPDDQPDERTNIGQTFAAAAEALVLSSTVSDRSVAEAASRLLDDLEVLLSESFSSNKPHLVQAATLATALWPRTFPLQEKMSLSSYIKLLHTPSVYLPNFRLASQMLNRVRQEAVSFSTIHFPQTLWHFFAKVSPIATVNDAASVASVADLLMLGGARLEAPSLNTVTAGGTNQEWSTDQITDVLVNDICNLLSHENIETMNTAFETLHAVFSVSSSYLTLSGVPALIGAAQLSRRLSTENISAQDLQGLLKGDKWLKKTARRQAWQREFTCLIASCLNSSNAFYGPLSPLLRQEPQFSQTSMPHLVHALLLQGRQTANDDAKRCLSAYFEQILTSQTPCVQDVVDLAVHLRRFKPIPHSSNESPLSGNHWLSIPWLALARGAVLVRAYTAGLLFLELAREHDDLALAPTPSTNFVALQQAEELQQILYAVYTNIEEPDGFYGIAPIDLQEGLLRRLQYEGRWMDALSWHGAAYETDQHEISAKNGIIKSLAYCDLSRVAMDFLEPAYALSSTALLSASLPYELAWKTEQWDLPSLYRADTKTSQANFFWALRAGQRELDVDRAQGSISRHMMTEASKLAMLHCTAPSFDKEAIEALVCIREIQKWCEQGPHTAESLAYRVNDLDSLS